VIIGLGALCWLLVRSGPKPNRLTYPCQQSALSLATAALGAPLVLAVLAGRAGVRRFLRSPRGIAAAGGFATLSLFLIASAYDRPAGPAVIATPPADYFPAVYLVNNARGPENGRFGGIDDLISVMGVTGLKWHRSAALGLTSGPTGLIDRDGVVLIKVNAQWSQRGGTNTDVLRGILRRIVEHPDGFIGEIVVADNGQGAGSLARSQNNAENQGQSVQYVVNDFAAEGWRVSTSLWDNIRQNPVGEYASGDLNDGYVLATEADPQTGIRVSYPKFRTVAGTYLSYKEGVWDADSGVYDRQRLVVINVPVLKTHSIYGVTAAVKNHMGVVTQGLLTDSHNSVGEGGLGSVLAEVRMPDLTILDCIWILARPGSGPSASYAQASRRDQLVAGADPVALDAWAVKNILIPQVIANGYTPAQYADQDPDNPAGDFRRYLDRSMNEMLLAGIVTTNDYDAVRLFLFNENAIPTVSEWLAIAMAGLLALAGAWTLRQRVPKKAY
jgi:hypothetical protein